jgi:S-formylglutathione hydrolase FrmB
MLDVSLFSGPVRLLLLVPGIAALAWLAVRRGRRWWGRAVPLAVLLGLLAGALVKLVVDVWWRPFPDPMPLVALVWAALVVTALALAVQRVRAAPRPRSPVTAVLALVATLLVLVTGLAQINQQYRAYPTLRTALGLPVAHQIDFDQVAPPTQPTVTASPGTPLTAVWTPPPNMPAHGAVTQVPVPGTRSGFPARPAWVYLPPAYLVSPRALLPVLVLLPGQPGSPRDWLDGGRLTDAMDAFATAHGGLAPVVVVPDPLGSRLAQTLCVDSPAGHAFTYLTVDVPSWTSSALQVDPDPAHRAVGGLSAGGTCALQLAVNAPSVYPTFLDLSGQDAPTVGSLQQTVAEFFGGDVAAYQRVNPLDVLASGRLASTAIAGSVVVGTNDSRYRPEGQRVYAALLAAGVAARYVELPGGHSWQVWSEGLRRELPFVATRTGLLPP